MTHEAAEGDMDINARLEKLEREDRRMKKIGIVAAVVVSTVILGGQARPSCTAHRRWNNPEVNSVV